MPAPIAFALFAALAALAQTPAPNAAPPVAPAAPPLASATSAAPSGPSATTPVPADPTANPAVAAIIRTCAADFAKVCPNIPPMSPEAQTCVRDNFDKLSEPCQASIMAMIGGAGSPS